MLVLPRLSFGIKLPPKLKLDDKFLRKFQNHIIKQHLQAVQLRILIFALDFKILIFLKSKATVQRMQILNLQRISISDFNSLSND